MTAIQMYWGWGLGGAQWKCTHLVRALTFQLFVHPAEAVPAVRICSAAGTIQNMDHCTHSADAQQQRNECNAFKFLHICIRNPSAMRKTNAIANRNKKKTRIARARPLATTMAMLSSGRRRRRRRGCDGDDGPAPRFGWDWWIWNRNICFAHAQKILVKTLCYSQMSKLKAAS